MSAVTEFSAIVDLGVSALQSDRSRSLILGFENALAHTDGAMFNDCFPLKHLFTPGVYAREILLPANSVIVGKIHRERHLNFISRGRVRVYTEHEGLRELVGPLTMISEPGTKRAVLVLEETVWTTIHHNPANETDLEKIEEFVIAPSFERYDGDLIAGLKLKELSS